MYYTRDMIHLQDFFKYVNVFNIIYDNDMDVDK